ncbi:N-acetylmuramoyl-L-alanine amidase [Carnimonas nigrificans]|uniref:N-acetylmuramoyl-L-alanine amidase n=1 Tax=Carnimonas nigrificans TaxID=64323 RepID=UPI000470122B|nr:N-acetylmuramoyl-L-alanine amidase [Carnimonas nigrificans]
MSYHSSLSAVRQRAPSIWCLLFFSLLMLVLTAQAAHAAQVRAVSSVNGSAEQRIRIDTSGAAVSKPHVFTLSNPSRVVVDLPASKVAPGNNFGSLRKNWVTNVRYGTLKGGTLRLVMDVSRAPQGQPKIETTGSHVRVIFGNTSTAAQPTAARTASKGATQAHRDIVVAIDPGHGGKDTGTIGNDGTYEKTVVLSIARQVINSLNKHPGFKAFMTRDGDYFLTLPERVDTARKHHADFFASIHANAAKGRSAHGTLIFALSEHGASSTMASWMARKENHSSMLNDADAVDLSDKSASVRRTLIDLSLGSKEERSSAAGLDLVRSIAKVNSMFNHKVEKANFAVLRSPDIPAVLIETDFLSSPTGLANLKSPAFQARMGQAIADGIVRYFQLHPPHKPDA